MAGPDAEVTVEVVLGEDVESFSDATLRVRLEDVTYADALSRTVDERVVEGVSHRAGRQQRLPVTLRAPGYEERTRYAVSAHLARGGPGADAGIRAGDYLTTQSYPVLTF